MKFLIRALLLELLIATASFSAQAAEPVPLVIVGTNDLHGALGNLSLFGGQLAILRQEHPDAVVLLDAGDLFSGTLEADLYEGAPVIAAYSALHYDAVAVGNHDFDYGPLGPRSTPPPGHSRSPKDDPRGALKKRAHEATFPFLARNIYTEGTHDRPDPFAPEGIVFLERHGIRIGIAGLATPTTPKTTNPANLTGLKFAPLRSEALKAAEALRAGGAEITILLIHEGGNCRRLKNPRSLYGCEVDGALIPLIESLPEGTFDVVVGGHTHHAIGHFVNGTPTIETTGHGAHFGLIELQVDPQTHRVLPDATRIEPMVSISADPFEGQPVHPDPEVERTLAPYLAKARALSERSLGITLSRSLTRSGRGDTPLGLAFADALRSETGADGAIVNSGGFRADLPAGPLTYGQLFEAYPFDNAIALIDLTGAELTELMERLLVENRTAPQLSGLRVEAVRCPKRLELLRFETEDGSPIRPDRHYRIATIDFLAAGGGGFRSLVETLPDGRVDLEASHKTARTAFAEWLTTHAAALNSSRPERTILRSERRCPEPNPT